jgi:hypothetical protein
LEFKDYYQVLGLDKSASEAEIKKSYRKLARKYHPDVSKEADAELRMKEVNEAYAVLGDLEKRAAYDQLGSPTGTVRSSSRHRIGTPVSSLPAPTSPAPTWAISATFSPTCSVEPLQVRQDAAGVPGRGQGAARITTPRSSSTCAMPIRVHHAPSPCVLHGPMPRAG